MKRNFFRWMIALVLMICVLPVAAFAEGEDLLSSPPPEPTPCELGNHSWVAGTPAHTNCGETVMVPYTCGGCSATKSEPAGTQKHVWDSGVVTPATCGTPGSILYTCQNGCGLKTTDTIPALTHSWVEGDVVTAATCTTAGTRHYLCQHPNCPVADVVQEYGPLNHSWRETDREAAICGKAGYVAYICNNDHSHTKTDVLPAKTHDWDEGTVVREASVCGAVGTKLYTCKNPGCLIHEVTQEYELEHIWKQTEHKAAICGEAGYTKYVCERDGNHTKTDTHAALRHNWDAGTVITAATCTTKGMKHYTCQNPGCPLGTVDQPYDALGHAWDAGQVTTAATCGKDGVKTYTCGNAGCTVKTKTEVIPATGAHKLSIMLSNSEYHYQYCWNEGCKYVTTGYHDWSRWRVARTATEEKDGLLRKDCRWCNQKKWSSYKYSDNPPTSDAVVIPAMVMLMSAAALPVAVHGRRKRK